MLGGHLRLVFSFAVAITVTSTAVATDFLFSEDNQITASTDQFLSSVQPKALLRQDKWLNEPLTRLDYVLMKIEAEMPERLNFWARQLVSDSFEKGTGDPDVTFRAGYYEAKQRLILSVDFKRVGKPKKPMKEVCKSILTYLGTMYPQGPAGFLWENIALGILARGDESLYQNSIPALFKSVMHMADITSFYDTGGKTSMFSIKCTRQEADGPIVYFKYSADLR
jgi:hypothetical protein